jgi:hypothetical protein
MFKERFQGPQNRIVSASAHSLERLSDTDLAEEVRLAEVKNKTLTMISRLRDPIIQEQMRKTAERYPQLFLKKPDEILAQMNAAIDRELAVTHIMKNRSTDSSSYNRLTEKAKIGLKGDKSNLYKEYVEAHEKEHAIRAPLLNAAFGPSIEMRKGFSFSSFVREKFKQLLIAGIWSWSITAWLGPASAATYMAQKVLTPSYMHSSWEIYARMSQLKNYFGFEGGGEFTGKHLAYAKQHYIEDTGVDNGMTAFLNDITSRSQKHFLYMINNFGV